MVEEGAQRLSRNHPRTGIEAYGTLEAWTTSPGEPWRSPSRCSGGCGPVYAFRNRGVASGLRGAGLTLLPARRLDDRARCEMFTDIGGAVGDWATHAGVQPRGLGGHRARRRSRCCCSAPPARCASAAGRQARAPHAAAEGKREKKALPEGVRQGRSRDRRRHGRHRGHPAQARHHLMAPPDLARDALWSRLNRAVAALRDPPGTPLMVVDLDAFDANADDLVRRAAGKPIRVASKSVRVPDAAAPGAGPRRLPGRAGVHPARGAVALRAVDQRRPGRRLPDRRPRGAAPAGRLPRGRRRDHADGRRRRPPRPGRLGPVLACGAGPGGDGHRRRAAGRRPARRAEALAAVRHRRDHRPGPRRRGPSRLPPGRGDDLRGPDRGHPRHRARRRRPGR